MLGNLCYSNGNFADELVKSGVADRLVRLLSNDDQEIKEWCVSNLWNLCACNSACKRIDELGAIPLMFETLKTTNYKLLQQSLLGAMNAMSTEHNCREKLLQLGILDILPKFYQMKENEEILKHSLNLVVSLMETKPNEAILTFERFKKSGIIISILDLLDDVRESIQDRVFNAVAAFSFFISQEELGLFDHPSLLKKIISGMKSSSAISRVCSSGILLNISFDFNQMREKVVQLGAIPLLLDLLFDSADGCKDNAAACLTNLVIQNESLCLSLIEMGVPIPVLYTCVTISEDKAFKSALQLLRNLSIFDTVNALQSKLINLREDGNVWKVLSNCKYVRMFKHLEKIGFNANKVSTAHFEVFKATLILNPTLESILLQLFKGKWTTELHKYYPSW